MDKKFCITLIVALVMLADICFLKLYTDCSADKKQIQQFDTIVSAVEDTESEENKYEKLYQQNKDFVGWIKVPDTNINYPVMQSKSNPDYYLNHNFKKEYSRFGVPFVQSDCDIETSDNIIIYGHNMRNGTMFNDLVEYEDRDFYEEHRLIYFDTLNEEGVYEIIAVYKTVANSGSGFAFNEFVGAVNSEEFSSYVQKCKALSLYNIGATAEYGDKLITLCTCEYSRNDGRLVVLAKKV